MPSPKHLLLLLLLSAPAVACGSSSSSSADDAAPGPAPSSTGEPPVAPIHGAFHFLVDADGAPAEVQKIVYTDAVTTRLDGLPPKTEVTISLTMYTPGRQGHGYVSKATFAADDAGVVDTSKQAPTSGTYAGVDRDGLFWSGVAGPVAEGLGPDRQAAFFEAKVGDASVAKAALGRAFLAQGVTVEKVTDDGLVAELFMPAGATDAVPVVAFGGSEGGLSGGEMFAADAASLGHPALAVAYFGAPGVPKDLTEIPLEYFAKAFAWLDKRPELRKGKAVVMGGSRGGELALQLAATFPNVVGVVAETPSAYRWASVGDAQKAAWTYGGAPLAFVPTATAGFPPTVDGPGGAPAYVLRGTFETDLAKATPEQLEAARIRIEDAKAAFLILAGASDQMWPACDFADRAMKRLTDAGRVAAYGDEALCFPDAGHAVGAVGLPTADSMWADIGGAVFALGGTAAGNAHAGRQSHDKIRAFLARVTK